MSDMVEDAAQPWALTPREGQVLQQLLHGLSNKETARELGISSRTIEVYRCRIIEKVGARNSVDLARVVMERDMQALRDMVRRLIEADETERARVVDEARVLLGVQDHG